MELLLSLTIHVHFILHVGFSFLFFSIIYVTITFFVVSFIISSLMLLHRSIRFQPLRTFSRPVLQSIPMLSWLPHHFFAFLPPSPPSLSLSPLIILYSHSGLDGIGGFLYYLL